VVPGEAPLGEDGLKTLADIIRRQGYAWRSHAVPEGRSVVPGEALLGEDGLQNVPYFPVNLGGRFSIKLATPSRKSLPRSATTISRLASTVASARVWNGTS
jgi:hypothetical protein